MEQTSCLCSVISLKYIHILHNNLHVTRYCYKLSYEFKKLVNAKMLALMDHIYSKCTYSVCVCMCVCFMWLLMTRCREMCTDWRDFENCLAVYSVEQQVLL